MGRTKHSSGSRTYQSLCPETPAPQRPRRGEGTAVSGSAAGRPATPAGPHGARPAHRHRHPPALPSSCPSPLRPRVPAGPWKPNPAAGAPQAPRAVPARPQPPLAALLRPRRSAAPIRPPAGHHLPLVARAVTLLPAPPLRAAPRPRLMQWRDTAAT